MSTIPYAALGVLYLLLGKPVLAGSEESRVRAA